MRNSKNYVFLAHVRKDLNSPHRNTEKACANLMNQSAHIQKAFECFTSQQLIENKIRLKASIDSARRLAFQGCTFRGHDETKTS